MEHMWGVVLQKPGTVLTAGWPEAAAPDFVLQQAARCMAGGMGPSCLLVRAGGWQKQQAAGGQAVTRWLDPWLPYLGAAQLAGLHAHPIHKDSGPTRPASAPSLPPPTPPLPAPSLPQLRGRHREQPAQADCQGRGAAQGQEGAAGRGAAKGRPARASRAGRGGAGRGGPGRRLRSHAMGSRVFRPGLCPAPGS